MNVSCSTEVDFTCSGKVEMCGSALREFYSVAAGFATCFAVYPAAAAGCSGWLE